MTEINKIVTNTDNVESVKKTINRVDWTTLSANWNISDIFKLVYEDAPKLIERVEDAKVIELLKSMPEETHAMRAEMFCDPDHFYSKENLFWSKNVKKWFEICYEQSKKWWYNNVRFIENNFWDYWFENIEEVKNGIEKLRESREGKISVHSYDSEDWFYVEFSIVWAFKLKESIEKKWRDDLTNFRYANYLTKRIPSKLDGFAKWFLYFDIEAEESSLKPTEEFLQKIYENWTEPEQPLTYEFNSKAIKNYWFNNRNEAITAFNELNTAWEWSVIVDAEESPSWIKVKFILSDC